ncbi:restriction endonuclease subunit S [Brevundimonas bullata]|uniref:restriction endonuclease subunit S n=1 Tax=Brevundimonas bullata TaxID=13160 RepID=UPI000E0C465B|nr:restriction endonuclease subunit S [Brevundimonas bullata]WQE36523.1 restriction endonuclease subunit S [Brevundimonas bullata]
MSPLAYDSHRDSGIDWLGKVPSHWDIVRLRRLVEIKKRIAGEEGPDVLSITQRGIKVRDTTSNDGQLASSYAHYQLVEPGDFAMNHMDLLTGWVDISPFHGVTSPDYRVFSARSGAKFDPRYLLWVLQQGYIGRTFFALGQGSSHLGRWRLPADAFNEFEVALPPQAEQRVIAAFLDRETGKIDALVEAQTRLIELLKEKRQAVISHAVTKGLDPAAPMKDSGVEWLGQVPAHWEVRRLGDISEELQTGPFGSQIHAKDYIDGGIPIINPSNIKEGVIRPNYKVSVTPKKASELAQHMLRLGDIVLARRGEMGRCGIVDEHSAGWLCGTGSLRIRLNKMNSAFIAAFIGTPFAVERLRLSSVGATMDNLNAEIVSRVAIPTPPLCEQEAIMFELSDRLSRLDALAASASSGVALLQERRSALISAAVTGKIDVRGTASQSNVVSLDSARKASNEPSLPAVVGACAILELGAKGRMAVMKAAYLAQSHARLEGLAGHYERAAAGPYDRTLMSVIERGAWDICAIVTHEPRAEGLPVTYEIPKSFQPPAETLSVLVGEERAKGFLAMLSLLKDIDRDGVEAVATLYAVWNDLLAAEKTADNDAICDGVFGWHAEKPKKFKRADLDHWLKWMGRNGLVPDGSAPRTDHQGSLFD